jgi:hypothetical protein
VRGLVARYRSPSIHASEWARLNAEKRGSIGSRSKRLAQKFMAYREAKRRAEPEPVDAYFNHGQCDARFAHFD